MTRQRSATIIVAIIKYVTIATAKFIPVILYFIGIIILGCGSISILGCDMDHDSITISDTLPAII